ncbi:hypothetical protein [Actinoplanes derwentensis]|uniref:PH domain-containing protein n=1 Tax=Actinoplanes derwentensis TaxID=113562 RepID=A0A1H1VKQ8_9ACTN|nr:hypothetical protein [Actinoplanes derwentensis]GID83667.1 hypothetical protein Ade03nite_25910 [Actinoplanes derwentensis]SDS85392.1 hypothetical protein SAMN04489716_1797 [Actinoplanes derwentensis]
MVLRFAALVVRRRSGILLAAMVLAVVGVGVAAGADQEPDGILGTAFGAAAVALILGAVVSVALRWRGTAGFEVDAERRVFRTPRQAPPVFVGLFMIGAWAGFATIGGWLWAHGDPDRGWIPFVLAMTAGVLVAGPFAWRGTGFALSADGIRADRPAGRVVIGWAALAPGPITHAEQHLDLTIADPAQITRQGVAWRPRRLAFEQMTPEFAAAVVRHYVEHPGDRAGIGTEAEHRRLTEMFGLTLRPAGPPPARGRVVVLAIGAVLLFGAGITVQAIEAGFAIRVVGTLLALLGLGLGGKAFRGARARKLLAG